MNDNQKIIFILQKLCIKCCFQTGSPSEHNGKAVADLSKSENDGETDLAPEKQKTKGKTKYSIADLLKQVWFSLCFDLCHENELLVFNEAEIKFYYKIKYIYQKVPKVCQKWDKSVEIPKT